MDKDLRTKLSVTPNTTVKVKPRLLTVKYVVAGALIFTLIGVAVFVYLNLGSSEDAAAGMRKPPNATDAPARPVLPDLSFLSREEMNLLTDRSFVRDTVRKDYTSVKWNVNASMSHLTLEVSNTKFQYTLELFDQNGQRVLNFINLDEAKVFVDKLQLMPNHQYNYVVRNTIGEMYAGSVMFN